MSRWYADRIGGIFTKQVEALADLALVKPGIGMAEIGLNCEPSNGHVARASLWIGNECLAGWTKHEDYQNMGKQMFLGSLATLLGAPSAPYIFIRGYGAVFSPECIERPHGLSTDGRYERLSAAALGAAGQFRAWINDTDGTHNMAANADGRFYMYDHDANPDWESCVNPTNIDFISESYEAACALNGGGSEAYFEAADEMARRIRNVTPAQLGELADTISNNTKLPICPIGMIDALIDRQELMQTPYIPDAQTRRQACLQRRFIR